MNAAPTQNLQKPLRKPYRVAIWGPGSVGMAALREAILLPEIEPVGVLAYREARNGVDAGTLAGMGPIGVPVTTDIKTFMASRPECVIYTGRDFGDWRQNDDLVMLLEAGIDVITALPYHYPQMHDPKAMHRLETAAHKGKATLFASGINPGVMFERFALAATGLCNDVQHISLAEYVNCDSMPGAGEFLSIMGFGMEQANKEGTERIASTVKNYLCQYLYFAAEKMGRQIDHIERDDLHVNTPVEIDIPDLMKLRANTVALVRFRWTAFSDGKPFLSTQVNWYMTDSMRPTEALGKGDDFWVVEVDARPGVRVNVELFATIKDKGQHFNPQNPSNVSLLSTAIPCIQAIPAVIAAEPGILQIEAPQFHWKSDLRVSA